jgi:hypothetical protein
MRIAIVDETLPRHAQVWAGGTRLLGVGAVPPRGEVYDLVLAPTALDGDAWLDDAIAPRVVQTGGVIKFLRAEAA